MRSCSRIFDRTTGRRRRRHPRTDRRSSGTQLHRRRWRRFVRFRRTSSRRSKQRKKFLEEEFPAQFVSRRFPGSAPRAVPRTVAEAAATSPPLTTSSGGAIMRFSWVSWVPSYLRATATKPQQSSIRVQQTVECST